jgi:hypothetical protein
MVSLGEVAGGGALHPPLIRDANDRDATIGTLGPDGKATKVTVISPSADESGRTGRLPTRSPA